jgi:hypothetical protein
VERTTQRRFVRASARRLGELARSSAAAEHVDDPRAVASS